MKLFHRLSAILIVGLACTAAGVAQEYGNWRAASNNAKTITGDVALSASRVTINQFAMFTVAQARQLTPAELPAAFNLEAADGGKGSLYRVSIPADKYFLHKNTLCGKDETTWMATAVSGKTLQIAFFSGGKPPVFTTEALANNTDLCGTYTYTR